MPVHDWTRVGPGIFHDFHGTWIAHLKAALNGGLLPPHYYALSEQVAGETNPDVVTLHAADHETTSGESGVEGAIAVVEAPPQVSVTAIADEAELYAGRRRHLAIRHTSGDALVALIEILSPGNKNRQRALEQFLDKAVSALRSGYHLLLVDLFPPGSFDPDGIHGLFWEEFDHIPYHAPPGKPLTLAAYSAGVRPRAYVEPIALGASLPKMPLFLEEGWYVNVPLEATYQEAYAAVPERWKRVIEARG